MTNMWNNPELPYMIDNHISYNQKMASDFSLYSTLQITMSIPRPTLIEANFIPALFTPEMAREFSSSVAMTNNHVEYS